MSVHVVVTKDVPEEKQAQWLSMADELALSTWKEDGCISYAFIKSNDKSTRFFIVEEWESQEKLNAHFETPHFKKLVPLMDEISTMPGLDLCSDSLTIQRIDSRLGKVLVLYDTSTKCTEQMADLVAEGCALVDQMEVRIRAVPGPSTNWEEPSENRTAKHPFACYDDVLWADGVAVGTPTNLGGISWRMKKFWDDLSQAGHWSKIDGKLGCTFSSQGGHGGGAELACMAMNTVLLNCGFSVVGSTDYVSFKNTMHYGAVVAKAPRDIVDQMTCRRMGTRLSEYVGTYVLGIPGLHPLKASKAVDLERWGYPGIPSREASIEDLVRLNTARVSAAKTARGVSPQTARKKVLIFTKMEAYVHGSTAAAASFVQTVCTEMGWQGIVSDDSTLLEIGNHSSFFDLIVFVQNSGEIFDPANEILSKHVAAGRGVMGIHAALACFLNGEDASGATILEPITPIFEQLFKAHFKNHPPVQKGIIDLDTAAATAFGLSGLPTSFSHTDEFFNFTKNPCDDDAVTVLAYVDETSYEGGLMGAKHPVVWHHTVGANNAPVFYCALGHFSHFYNGLGPDTVAHFIRAGLRYCMK